MVLKRKIYQKLLEWKNETKGQKALLIEGARRIGKSTIVLDFAEKEYESYLLIDFSIAPKDIKEYFEYYMTDIDTLFALLMTYYNVRLIKRKSLVIFDEIQFCPKAREAIKHLVKDGRYDYIETGSLISVKENVKDILIPSEERHIKMFPLDFEEFLWAMNENGLCELIKKHYIEKKPLPDLLHRKALILFKQYVIVGGMPKCIVSYIENGKLFYFSESEKRDILELYRSDILKIDSSYKYKVLAVFDQIPGFLSKHEKKIVFKNLGGGNRMENYEETFFWLADSQIANECFLCNDPNIGLSLNEDRSYIKCYLGDTGLLLSHTFDESELDANELYKKILFEDLGVNNGMFFENVVAQSLVANGHKLFFYKHYNAEKHRNDIEIDFIISNKSKTNFKIYPIEVKSGKQYSTKSLEHFIDKFKDRIGCSYIIHPKNLEIKENGIICIPCYMTFCL